MFTCAVGNGVGHSVKRPHRLSGYGKSIIFYLHAMRSWSVVASPITSVGCGLWQDAAPQRAAAFRARLLQEKHGLSEENVVVSPLNVVFRRFS